MSLAARLGDSTLASALSRSAELLVVALLSSLVCEESFRDDGARGPVSDGEGVPGGGAEPPAVD